MSIKNIFVAGHTGMVGSAIIRQLNKSDNVEIITRTRKELDLTCQYSVREFFKTVRIDEVYLAAAKVGGILANSQYPADFIYENLLIEANVVHNAHMAGIQKLLFLGSSCIYPKFAPQPMVESALLAGALEPTNEPYAIAKISGIKLCESYNRQYGRDYRSVMPTNLYGPNDNFHAENSHVIPGLIRRFHEAKVNNEKNIYVWGSGNPRREFLHVDDMASASIYVMNLDYNIYCEHVSETLSHVNVGTGEDCTIRELALLVAEVVGFSGDVLFDTSKPDGAPKKLLNVDKLARLGWTYSVALKEGLGATYRWYIDNIDKCRV